MYGGRYDLVSLIVPNMPGEQMRERKSEKMEIEGPRKVPMKLLIKLRQGLILFSPATSIIP